MTQTSRSFRNLPHPARLVGLSLLVACLGMLSASAQQFADFESGMDGFSVYSAVDSNFTVTAATTNLVATSGANSLCVSQFPDGFSWVVELSGTASTGNTNFYNAVDAARNDPTNAYEIVFDVIYVSNSIPNAGTTNINWINYVVVMEDDTPTWIQPDDAVGAAGEALLQNLTGSQAEEVRVSLSLYEDLSKSTASYRMIMSMNGNWGTNDTISLYFDNFRVEPKNYVLYDFEDGLQDWVFDEGCGSVNWRTNFPGMGGDGMLFLDHSNPGPCRTAKSTGPGPGGAFISTLAEVVNDDPSKYNLEFDFILRRDYLPVDATFVRPMIGIFGDGLGWEGGQVLNQFEVDLTTLTGTATTSVHVSVRLDTLRTIWPDPGWAPTWVQLQAGKDCDGNDLNGVYYDNFALVPLFVPEAVAPVITEISVDGDVAVTWDSSDGTYYQVEQASSLNPDWAPVSDYAKATPPENTWTGAVAAGSPIFYRVGATLTPEIPLFDYETGEEAWVPHADYPSTVVTVTNLFATSGSNSLAVATDATGWGGRASYANPEPLESNMVWNTLSNAYASGDQWYLATDITWNGPDILGSGLWGAQVWVVFNSAELIVGGVTNGGWSQFMMSGLDSGTTASLQSNSNSITVTWSVPLEDTNWFVNPTNDFIDIYYINNGPFTGLTTYVDNWRLTTVQP